MSMEEFSKKLNKRVFEIKLLSLKINIYFYN